METAAVMPIMKDTKSIKGMTSTPVTG